MNFDFIRYSFISGILVGLIAPLIGAFIVYEDYLLSRMH